ncbi:MAG: ATP-binding protein [Desulfobulbaceae bacterium]|nr:ATP-binding protein [Desulfobulbaceae bacterium]
MKQEKIATLLPGNTKHLSKEKRIFDLRAEYAITAVSLALVAEHNQRILALSIDPDLPRYFEGNPRPFRKIFTRLIKTALLADDVDVVTARIDHEGSDNQGRCLLKLSITANGPGITPAAMHILRQPTRSAIAGRCDKNSHALLVVSRQVRRMGGQLRIESLHGWGTRYVIEFKINQFSAPQVFATAS